MTEVKRRIRIAIDAMGGDYAPQEMVKGAVEAAERDEDIELILAGPLGILESELAKYDTSGLVDVAICDAFVGNMVLKLIESLALFADSDVPGAYRDWGGGIIWGVDGIVRKMHGDSRAHHVAVKINDVKQVVETDLIGVLKSEFARVMKELK